MIIGRRRRCRFPDASFRITTIKQSIYYCISSSIIRYPIPISVNTYCGSAGFCSSFLRNMCHIHAQNTVIIVRIRPLDIRNNRIIRHDSAGILCQQGDNLKLDLRQMDILSINRYQMFFKIDRQSLCMEWALIKRRSCLSGCCGAGQSGCAREALEVPIELGQIIIRAKVERTYLFLFLRAGGEDDDRDAGPGADLADDPCRPCPEAPGRGRIRSGHWDVMIGSASFPVCAVECGNPVRTGRREMKSQMFFSSSTNKIESLCVMLFVLLWKSKVKFGTARVVDCLDFAAVGENDRFYRWKARFPCLFVHPAKCWSWKKSRQRWLLASPAGCRRRNHAHEKSHSRKVIPHSTRSARCFPHGQRNFPAG